MSLDETIREVGFNIMLSSDFSSLKSPKERSNGIFSELNKPTRFIHLKTDVLAKYIAKHRAKIGFLRPFLKVDTQGKGPRADNSCALPDVKRRQLAFGR